MKFLYETLGADSSLSGDDLEIQGEGKEWPTHHPLDRRREVSGRRGGSAGPFGGRLVDDGSISRGEMMVSRIVIIESSRGPIS